jgi:hypothetical protein
MIQVLAALSGACRSEPEAGLTVFGQIENRDHVLLLHGGGIYTVKAKDGTVLAEAIDAAALQRHYPALFDLVNDAPDEDTIEIFY